jgi:hypothetical protein
MANLGWFRGERAELFEGEIMVLSPQGPSGSYLADHVAALLREFGWPLTPRAAAHLSFSVADLVA